jgi:hypothetical protein
VLQRDLRPAFGPSPGHGASRQSPQQDVRSERCVGGVLYSLFPNNVKRGHYSCSEVVTMMAAN